MLVTFTLQLLDVKSTDRRKTLMNYLSQLIEAEYPELLNFYEDMKIDVPRGGMIK